MPEPLPGKLPLLLAPCPVEDDHVEGSYHLLPVARAEMLQVLPAQNYGDVLRSVPGVNVIQRSARDINLTSRQATRSLATSQLTLPDGRSIYLDFLGLILWDFVPTNPADIKRIEVVRGPAPTLDHGRITFRLLTRAVTSAFAGWNVIHELLTPLDILLRAR